MKSNYEFQVTVIVASYNPNFNDMYKTLISILKQKNISKEIIVVDDCSQNNLFREIEEVFFEHDFCNYSLIDGKVNEGTCKNIFKGAKIAAGKYIKLISPGDFLYSDDILALWYLFMEENNVDISFGNAVYYNNLNSKFEILKLKNNPMNRFLYEKEKYNSNKVRINYLVLRDHPVGAAFLIKKDILRKYLEKIVGKIVYAEDVAYRLMLFSGIKIEYFSKEVVFYEYGNGVSTSQNSKWLKILKAEIAHADNLLLKENMNNDKFCRKYKKFVKVKANSKLGVEVKRCIFFPYYFYLKARSLMKPTYSSTNIDMEFVDEINYEMNKRG